MKHLAILFLLALPLSAQRPVDAKVPAAVATERQNGTIWLASEIARLKGMGQTWNKGKEVWGDLMLPASGIFVTKPLVLPLRCSLIGPRSYLRGTNNVWVDPTFPIGGTVFSWKPSRSQGAFSHYVRNVSIDCNRKANGMKIDGDQGSRYEGIEVWEPMEWGIYAENLSHGTTLERISVEGPYATRQITGIRIGSKAKSTTAVFLNGISINWAKVGIHRFNCGTVDDNSSFEHVSLPYLTERSVSCDSRAHFMLSGTKEIMDGAGGKKTTVALLVQTTDSKGITVRGTARKSVAATSTAKSSGDTIVLSNRANKNDPFPFHFSN